MYDDMYDKVMEFLEGEVGTVKVNKDGLYVVTAYYSEVESLPRTLTELRDFASEIFCGFRDAQTFDKFSVSQFLTEKERTMWEDKECEDRG